jgi:predicted phosphodiesterase
VRGNVDTEAWARRELPETAVAQAGDVSIYVLHDVHALDLNPAAAGFQIVVSGHSHKYLQTEKDGVLYINPGSAGPRRFTLPITVARLDLAAKPWKVEFVDLEKI